MAEGQIVGGGSPIAIRQPPTLSFSTVLRRREDFVSLHFDFYNLQITNPKSNPVLTRIDPGNDAWVVVSFPPQSVVEHAFPETQSAGVPTTIPAGSRLSGPSRLAFSLPTTVTSIAYTSQGLLTWLSWQTRVVPSAHAGPWPESQGSATIASSLPPTPRAPTPDETAIEVPWWLILSPDDHAAWEHATGPVTSGPGWTELWHTRLALPAPNLGHDHFAVGAVPAKPTVRAVWATDLDMPSGPVTMNRGQPYPPTEMAMTSQNRLNLVANSGTFTTPGYTPRPINVDRLMLSSMGAWLDSDGQWRYGLTSPNDLIEWRHRSTMGRDHYVKIVHQGYLYPFGHQAVFMIVSERKFEPTKDGTHSVAYLMRRQYIVVRKPVKVYGTAAVPLQPNDGRAFPFRQVKVTSTVTPNLDVPVAYQSAMPPLPSPPPPQDADPSPSNFIPYLVNPTVGPASPPAGAHGVPYLFHMVGTDWAGNEVEFATPVVFVYAATAFDYSSMQAISSKFTDRTDLNAAFWTRDLHGQRVTLAEVTDADPGATTQQLVTVTWGAEAWSAPTAALVGMDQPAAFPTMAAATVRLAPAEQASGHPIPGGPITIALHEAYVSSSFDPGTTNNVGNPGEVYARSTAGGAGLKFPADKSGGLVTPNLGITGLSRINGPVGGDLTSATANKFDPGSFFDGLDAKILGGIDLSEILAPGFAMDKAPALHYKVLSDQVQTHMRWVPQLQHDSRKVFIPYKTDGFTLDALVTTHLADPTNSTFTVKGVLHNFDISLFGDGTTQFLLFHFNSFSFLAVKGHKTKIDTDIAKVEFKGVLDFVNQLAKLLSGHSGPAIDVTPTQVSATIALPIPTIAVGVFSMQNMSLNISVVLPFSGKPARVRIYFCTRENPFILTVSMFGGGGFFGLALGTDGMELLEASLEFGASVSIDLYIASGGVSIMAGIYFKLQQQADGTDQATLTGFLKIDGNVHVLGIFSASIELYLGFTYMPAPANKCSGQAKLSLSVGIGPFAVTVSTTVEKHFGNNNADPTFGDLVSAPDWATYCAAFDAAPQLVGGQA